MSKYSSESNMELFEAISKLETVEECKDFFEDLCTIQELASMAQRFKVATLLLENKVYTDIAELTGASTATISRVNRSLRFGNNGYDIVLSRLKK